MVDVGQIFAGDFYRPNSVGGILAPSDKRVWGFFHLPSHLQPLNSRSLPIKSFFSFVSINPHNKNGRRKQRR